MSNSNAEPNFFTRIVSVIVIHLFIVATGFAALIHSTWSIATVFNGKEPAYSWDWWGWVLPAFLIAFAIDIGQIVTSAQIQRGERTRAKYATFAVFAVATYFLQFLYCVAHIPLIDLSAGVRPEWATIVRFVVDSSVFVVPAFLPLSTLLYTFSYSPVKRNRTSVSQTNAQPIARSMPSAANNSHLPSLPSPNRAALTAGEPTTLYEAHCPYCDWQTVAEARRTALNRFIAHYRQCDKAQGPIQYVVVESQAKAEVQS